VKIYFLPFAFVLFLPQLFRTVSTAAINVAELLIIVLVLGNNLRLDHKFGIGRYLEGLAP
jgi:hypothetical protein